MRGEPPYHFWVLRSDKPSKARQQRPGLISFAYLEACQQMQLTAVLESIQSVVLIGCCQFEGLSVGFWHTTSNITHIISHGMTLVSVLYIHSLKVNLQATESSSSHLIVAASVTLTKLNRALLTGVRQARLRQATTRIASACNQLSNAYVRLVGSCFYDWFFQVYANNYGWSF